MSLIKNFKVRPWLKGQVGPETSLVRSIARSIWFLTWNLQVKVWNFSAWDQVSDFKSWLGGNKFMVSLGASVKVGRYHELDLVELLSFSQFVLG